MGCCSWCVSGSWLRFFAENSTKCCSFFSLGFSGEDGVCFFGFVMSLGFSNCIIFLETSAFPNSHDRWLCSLARNHGTVWGPFARFSLSYNRILWVVKIGFPLSDVPFCDFSLVSIELIFGMASLPAGSGIVALSWFFCL